MDEFTSEGYGFVLGLPSLSETLMEFPEPGNPVNYQKVYAYALTLHKALALEDRERQQCINLIKLKHRFQDAEENYMKICCALMDMEAYLIATGGQSVNKQPDAGEDDRTLRGGLTQEDTYNEELANLEWCIKDRFTRLYGMFRERNMKAFYHPALRLQAYNTLSKATTLECLKTQLQTCDEATKVGVMAAVLRLSAWMEGTKSQNRVLPAVNQFRWLFQFLDIIDNLKNTMDKVQASESLWPVERFMIDLAVANRHFTTLGLRMAKTYFLNEDLPGMVNRVSKLGLVVEPFPSEQVVLHSLEKRSVKSDPTEG